MYPELFKIGSFTIYAHGFMAVIGIVFGGYILYSLAKKNKLNTNFLFDNIIYSVLAGIIGARITYYFLYPDQFNNFWEIFFLWQGGMVSYGGFIPGFAVFIGLLRLEKAKVNDWLAISAIAFPLGLFWGRLGNLLAGEYAGVSTASQFSINNSVPIPAYEGILLLIIALTIFYFYKRDLFSRKFMFLIFILAYSGGRFIIDFWRDESDLFLNLAVGQITSLLIFITAFCILVRDLRLGRKQHEIT